MIYKLNWLAECSQSMSQSPHQVITKLLQFNEPAFQAALYHDLLKAIIKENPDADEKSLSAIKRKQLNNFLSRDVQLSGKTIDYLLQLKGKCHIELIKLVSHDHQKQSILIHYLKMENITPLELLNRRELKRNKEIRRLALNLVNESKI